MGVVEERLRKMCTYAIIGIACFAAATTEKPLLAGALVLIAKVGVKSAILNR